MGRQNSSGHFQTHRVNFKLTNKPQQHASMITYRQLLEKLQTLNEEQLNQTATVSLDESDEMVPIECVSEAMSDVLDEGHIVLGVAF